MVRPRKRIAIALSALAFLSLAGLSGCGNSESENKGPYASEVESNQVELHPLDVADVTPDNLYAGEYLNLAKHYIRMWNYRQAAICLEKVKKLAPGTRLEAEALHSEKYLLFSDKQYQKWKKVEELREKDEEYKAALARFVAEYPNCKFALNELYENTSSDDVAKNEDLRKRLHAADPENSEYFDVEPENYDFMDFVSDWGRLVSYVFQGGVKEQELNHSGFIDKKGHFVFHQADSVESSEDFSEQISLADTEYLDPTGKTIKTPEFETGYHFSEGFAPIKTLEGWGFINTKGEFVTKTKLESVLWYSEGLAPVKVGDNWGYMNKSQKIVIKPQYEQALCFREGLAAILVNSKVGFIDKSGKIVVPAKYDVAESFSEGLARVTILETPINRRHDYFIDPKGKIVFDLKAIKLKYDPLGSSLHFGNIDFDIDRIIAADTPPHPIEHFPSIQKSRDSINFFHDERLLVQLGEMMGYLDKTGKVAINPNFYQAENFSDGLAVVSLDPPDKLNKTRPRKQRLGFIDKTGKMVIPAKYSEARSFSEGLAFVRETNGAAGFIDKSGKKVIDVMGEARDFHEGLAPVSWEPSSPF